MIDKDKLDKIRIELNARIRENISPEFAVEQLRNHNRLAIELDDAIDKLIVKYNPEPHFVIGFLETQKQFLIQATMKTHTVSSEILKKEFGDEGYELK